MLATLTPAAELTNTVRNIGSATNTRRQAMQLSMRQLGAKAVGNLALARIERRSGTRTAYALSQIAKTFRAFATVLDLQAKILDPSIAVAPADPTVLDKAITRC
jgi:hypothetical protein